LDYERTLRKYNYVEIQAKAFLIIIDVKIKIKFAFLNKVKYNKKSSE